MKHDWQNNTGKDSKEWPVICLRCGAGAGEPEDASTYFPTVEELPKDIRESEGCYKPLHLTITDS